MQPWPALKHPNPALPSRCPWALRIMVVPGEDVELGGQWRARHRWTANDLSFATVPLAASSVGFETLYEAIRKSRTVSAFPGGSPVTEKSPVASKYCGKPLRGCVGSRSAAGAAAPRLVGARIQCILKNADFPTWHGRSSQVLCGRD